MNISNQEVELYSKEIIDLSNLGKVDIISEINDIIKPHLRKSGYIDDSNYVNGFRPNGEPTLHINIAETKDSIFIPRSLVIMDVTLNNFSNEKDSVTTNFLSSSGLHLEFGCFSDYYSHSVEVLKVILMQLRRLDFN